MGYEFNRDEWASEISSQVAGTGSTGIVLASLSPPSEPITIIWLTRYLGLADFRQHQFQMWDEALRL